MASTPQWVGGGKEATAREQARHFGMQLETADSPRGNDGRVDRDLFLPARHAWPKSSGKKEQTSPAMTERSLPRTSEAGNGTSAGPKGLAPEYGFSTRTPASRRAGCETHKSGSVGAGGGQPPLATRHFTPGTDHGGAERVERA